MAICFLIKPATDMGVSDHCRHSIIGALSLQGIAAGAAPLIVIIVIFMLMRAYRSSKELPMLHAQMAAEAEQ